MTGMDHIDARVVLNQDPNFSSNAHIAIQCKKTGASINALSLHNKAMPFMRNVRGLNHFFVLAVIPARKVKLPTEAEWPETLIVVDSYREFAPLLANYVDYNQ